MILTLLFALIARKGGRPVLLAVAITIAVGGYIVTRPDTTTVFVPFVVADAPPPDSPPDAPPPDSPPDTPTDAPVTPCYAVLQTGQSNTNGAAVVSELTGGDVALADPYADVDQVVRMATGASYPPTWSEYSLSALQPRILSGVYKFGIELTMGRDLATARTDVRWRLIKAGIGGTTLADTWDPSNALPSIFDDVHDWIDSQLGGCTPVAYIWIQGESDAGQVSRANAYGTNLTAYVNAVRTRYPSIPFIYGRLHVSTSATYTSVVRTKQAALATSASYMIDQDGGTLRADGLHYTTPSVITLGHSYATKVLEVAP